MKSFILVFIIAVSFGSSGSSQSIQVYTNFEEFESRLYQDSDTLYLINFWATWCVPCVKEMPAINQIAKKYSSSRLKILLVSMDMPRQIDSRLIPFIDKHGVSSEVVLLDDPDFNSWIDKVDTSWGGGIPATLIYSKKSRSFYEKSFEFEELDKIINTKLNEL